MGRAEDSAAAAAAPAADFRRRCATIPPPRASITCMKHFCALLLLALGLHGPAFAQTWPSRPVRVVVPAPAGSSLDVIVAHARRQAQGPLGAAGRRREQGRRRRHARHGRRSPRRARRPHARHRLQRPDRVRPAHVQEDAVRPGARICVPVVLDDLAAQRARGAGEQSGQAPSPEFVAWAKEQGGKLSYGSVGNGSSSHLTMELFKSVAGFDAVHVPYAGSPPAGDLARRRRDAGAVHRRARAAAADPGRTRQAHRRDERCSAPRRCRSCRPSPSPAIRASRRSRGTACSRPPARRRRPSRRSTPTSTPCCSEPAVRESLRKQGLDRRRRHERRVQGLHRAGEPDLGRDHQEGTASPSTERRAAPIPAPRLPSRPRAPARGFPAVSTRFPISRPPRRRLQPMRPRRVVFGRAIAIVITLPHCVIKTQRAATTLSSNADP